MRLRGRYENRTRIHAEYIYELSLGSLLVYTVGLKNVPLELLADFKSSFTVGLSSIFATMIVSYFPPHLKRVTTLPCEIQK